MSIPAIYKGDDTDFRDVDGFKIRLSLAEDIDITDCTVEVVFHGVSRRFPAVPGSETVYPVKFTAAETARFPLGVSFARVRVWDAESRVRTIMDTVRIKVTDSVMEAYGTGTPQELVIDIGGEALPEIPEDLSVTDDDSVLELKKKFNSVLSLFRKTATPCIAALLSLPVFGADPAYTSINNLPGTAEVVMTNTEAFVSAEVERGVHAATSSVPEIVSNTVPGIVSSAVPSIVTNGVPEWRLSSDSSHFSENEWSLYWYEHDDRDFWALAFRPDRSLDIPLMDKTDKNATNMLLDLSGTWTGGKIDSMQATLVMSGNALGLARMVDVVEAESNAVSRLSQEMSRNPEYTYIRFSDNTWEKVLFGSDTVTRSDIEKLCGGNWETENATRHVREIVFGAEVVYIGPNCFEGSPELRSVRFPYYGCHLESRAFAKCLLSKIDMDKVASFGPYCFAEAAWMPYVVKPTADQAFSRGGQFLGCKMLAYVDLTDSFITEIGSYAFFGAWLGYGADLGDRITKIQAFSLSSVGTESAPVPFVTVPPSVTYINPYAFATSHIAKVIFEGRTMAEISAMSGYPWGLDTSVITNAIVPKLTDIPTKVSQLENDRSFASYGDVNYVFGYPNYGGGGIASKIMVVGDNNTLEGQWAQLVVGHGNTTKNATGKYILGERNYIEGLGWAFGDEHTSNKEGSMSLGFRALNTNEWAFVWGGMYNPYNSPPAASHGDGSFSIYPIGGMDGFWVGDQSMSDYVEKKAKEEARKIVNTAGRYVWDKELEVCYRLNVQNGFLDLVAVTNIDLTLPENYEALEAMESKWRAK